MEENSKPEQEARPDASIKSSQGSIEMQGPVLRVTVNLDQPNGMIIAMGILEVAKRAVDSWEMRKKASAIVTPKSNGFKTFTQKLMGGLRG